MEPITVVMPARNAEGTIARAAHSALKSMSHVDELLIVEDGSTDNTMLEISKLRDGRVKVIQNDVNMGIGPSLNVGIAAAKHTIIGRADADDIVPRWRFAVQRRVFKSARADILFGSQIIVMHKIPLPAIYSFVTRSSKGSLKRAMSLACIVAHPTMMTRKDVILDLGGYRNVVAEDYDLWLRALLADYVILRHWFPQNIYRISRNSQGRKDAKREQHLRHLAEMRVLVFDGEPADSSPYRQKMRRYRRRLAISDPLLFVETGLFRDPLSTL